MTRLDAGQCRLFLKLENQNPGGSIKDRIALSMVEAAERDLLTGLGNRRFLTQRIKEEIGCAYPGGELREIDVRGRNLAEGIPRSFTLNSHEILDALQETLASIVSAVKNALEQSPPELASDIAERGLVLTGGGALLRDLDKLIAEETGLPVIVAEDPLTCVARGGGKALEMIDQHTFELLSSD